MDNEYTVELNELIFEPLGEKPIIVRMTVLVKAKSLVDACEKAESFVHPIAGNVYATKAEECKTIKMEGEMANG